MKLNKKSVFMVGFVLVMVVAISACSLILGDPRGRDTMDATTNAIDTTAPTVSITAGPTNDIITNQAFTVSLAVNINYGYWSTNGSAFEAFPKGTKDIIISNDMTLMFYGSIDGVNTSSTQTTHYYIRYDAQVYVSLTGNDANDGKTIANAVLTIQKAVELAKSYSYARVYVEAGTYQQGTGLSNNLAANNFAGIKISGINFLNLIGGWNAAFDTQNGISIFDGQNTLCHVIWADNVSNLTIDGFTIINGNANGSDPHFKGGGVYYTNVSYSVITNCIIKNNSADYGGGGMLCTDSDYNTIWVTITNNYGVSRGEEYWYMQVVTTLLAELL